MREVNCNFRDRCKIYDCEFCNHNPEACTQSMFVWNGEGEEPTEEELMEDEY